jgi:hypothetical protein
MKRNLKALGLALMTVLAISAVAASAAHALDAHFTQPQGKYPFVGTGEQEGLTANNYFQITGPNGPKVHCKIAKYEATVEVETTILTVTPHYTECVTTRGGLEVGTSVDLNGCHFRFEAGEYTAVPNDAHNTLVHIICPVGQQIEVTAGPCHTDIPAQTIKTTGSEVTYTNLEEGGIKYVTVHVDITEKLTYTQTKTNFFCPESHFHGANGSFVSTVRFDCYEDKENKAVKTKDPDGTEWAKNEYIHGVGRINCDVAL